VVSRQNRTAHLNRGCTGLKRLNGWSRGVADRPCVSGPPRPARARSGGRAAGGWTGGRLWPGCAPAWRTGGPGRARGPRQRRRCACCV